MKKYALLLTLAATLIAAGGCAGLLGMEKQGARKLAHDVYFELNNDTFAARLKLIDDCYKYLRDHPGVISFSAGELVEAHDREVNVRDWQVSLHIVFKSKAHHDAYQNIEDHHKFIEENKDNWKSVRVFDSYIR